MSAAFLLKAFDKALKKLYEAVETPVKRFSTDGFTKLHKLTAFF